MWCSFGYYLVITLLAESPRVWIIFSSPSSLELSKKEASESKMEQGVIQRRFTESGPRLSGAQSASFSLPFSALPRLDGPAGPRRSRLDLFATVSAVAQHLHLYCERASSACSAKCYPNHIPPNASPEAGGLCVPLPIKPWFSSPPRFLFHLHSAAFASICHCCSLASSLPSNLSLPSLLPSPPLCRLTACRPT